MPQYEDERHKIEIRQDDIKLGGIDALLDFGVEGYLEDADDNCNCGHKNPKIPRTVVAHCVEGQYEYNYHQYSGNDAKLRHVAEHIAVLIEFAAEETADGDANCHCSKHIAGVRIGEIGKAHV